MVGLMTAVMWAVVGICVLFVLAWMYGHFAQEKDKIDAYKFLAEKQREKEDR